MRFLVPAALLVVAVIHLLPLAGVISGSRVANLYGIVVQDPTRRGTRCLAAPGACGIQPSADKPWRPPVPAQLAR